MKRFFPLDLLRDSSHRLRSRQGKPLATAQFPGKRRWKHAEIRTTKHLKHQFTDLLHLEKAGFRERNCLQTRQGAIVTATPWLDGSGFSYIVQFKRSVGSQYSEAYRKRTASTHANGVLI